VNAVILSREFATEMEKMFTRDLAEPERVQMGRMGEKTFVPRGQRVVCASIFTLAIENQQVKEGPCSYYSLKGIMTHAVT
jgi:hypothetical protein